METNKLAADPSAIVLTILSLIIILLGCCCGLFAIVSLTLSIIGLVMANKSLREYALAPENYSVNSYKTVNTAKILGIIGIVLSALVIMVQIAFFMINGEEISKQFWEEFEKGKHVEKEWKWEVSSDSIGDDTTIELKKQGDSIVIDTVAAKTQQ